MPRLPAALRGSLLCLTILLATVPGAVAQDQGAPQGGPRGERFYIALPVGWVEAARTTQKGADVLAYVPQGQSASDWTDMLTVQIFGGMAALPAQTYYDRARGNVAKTCDGPRAGVLQSGLSNGYPSAFWVLGCGRNRGTGLGETSFFRIIQGDSALYMAQRTWRTKTYTDGGPPVADAAAQQAIEVLRSFGVCNPLADGHACPALPGR